MDYFSQKDDPCRTCIAVGGNLIKYLGEVSTRVADLKTAKLIFKSTISALEESFMCYDIKNFSLGTPMKQYEYIRLPLNIIPEEIIEQYNLRAMDKTLHVHLMIS